MPFIARYGFLLLVLVFCGCFHLSIALLVVAFCWYEKPKRATKGKKCPNGNQALKNNRFGCLPAGKLTLSGEREPLVLIIVHNTALLNAA